MGDVELPQAPLQPSEPESRILPGALRDSLPSGREGDTLLINKIITSSRSVLGSATIRFTQVVDSFSYGQKSQLLLKG